MYSNLSLGYWIIIINYVRNMWVGNVSGSGWIDRNCIFEMSYDVFSSLMYEISKLLRPKLSLVRLFLSSANSSIIPNYPSRKKLKKLSSSVEQNECGRSWRIAFLSNRISFTDRNLNLLLSDELWRLCGLVPRISKIIAGKNFLFAYY